MTHCSLQIPLLCYFIGSFVDSVLSSDIQKTAAMIREGWSFKAGQSVLFAPGKTSPPMPQHFLR